MPALLLVLLGHGLLYLLLNQAGRRAAPPAPARLITLRWIAPTPPPAATQRPPNTVLPAVLPPAPPAAPRAPTRARAATAAPRMPTTQAAAVPPGASADADVAASAPLADRAPPPAQPPSLLDSEGTRRALRQAAREPLLAERAAAATQAPAVATAQQRLGREIGQSASGDCLKGEFAGSGMGLLSLPFWALAEARGKCRR